jgi:predicted nucleic acid-binding protein
MNPSPVVADASPLIALTQIDALGLLHELFGSVSVPPAVAREIKRTVPGQSWISERPLSRPVDPRVLVMALRPYLDALIEQGFFMSPVLYEHVLAEAEETPP